MLVGKELDNASASRASILMKTGACVGGTVIGYTSQWLGRRRAMILSCFICCCLIPAWILPNSFSGLSAGGFMIQFFIQGAWGVVPIYLSEVSPPAFRAMFVGLCYQIGNALSSPSTQLINALSESNYIKGKGGELVQAYGPVMGIATAIIAIGLALTAAVGPEKKGAHFEQGAAATEAGAGVQEVATAATAAAPQQQQRGQESQGEWDDEEKKGDGTITSTATR